jgi:hypothetical protein
MLLSQPEQLTHFLIQLSQRYAGPATLYIFGGSAVLWLGGARHTADVDFTAEPADPLLREAIAQTARELDLDFEESVPADFMPLPAGVEARHQRIGQFGSIAVYLFDLYSIATMKIDRAFDSDMEDVRFLIEAGHIDLTSLAHCIEDVAARYDEPLKLRRNFEELKRDLNR